MVAGAVAVVVTKLVAVVFVVVVDTHT